MEQRTGLKFKVTKTGNLDEMLKQLMDGEVDMVASVRSTPSRALYAHFSRPFVKTPLYLFYKTPNLTISTALRIASVGPFAVTAHLEEEGFQVTRTLSDDDGLNLLAKGEVDAVALDAGTANFLFKRRPDMKSLHAAPYDYAYPLALAQRKDPILNEIIRKAQDTISDGELQKINEKWSTLTIKNNDER